VATFCTTLTHFKPLGLVRGQPFSEKKLKIFFVPNGPLKHHMRSFSHILPLTFFGGLAAIPAVPDAKPSRHTKSFAAVASGQRTMIAKLPGAPASS
jgi:hypothetical protein